MAHYTDVVGRAVACENGSHPVHYVDGDISASQGQQNPPLPLVGIE